MPSRCPPARRGALFRTIGLALVLVGAGCRVVAGIDDRAPPTADVTPQICGGLGESYFVRLAARSPDCLSCLTELCCEEGTACGGKTACGELSACREICAPYDVACEQRCESTHAEGVATLDVLKKCTLDLCTQECRVGTLWDCVGKTPAPKKDASGSITVQLALNAIGGSPSDLDGAVVEACDLLDTSCQTPAAKATADANGKVTLTLESIVESLAFDGYLRVTHDGYVPLYVLMNPPLVADVTLPPFVVPPSYILDSFASLADTSVAQDAGHIIAFALDCGGAFAPGVSYEAMPTTAETRLIYTTGNYVPDKTLKETTAKLGLGVVLNVPPGEVTISYTVNAQQLLVGSHKVRVFPGAITQVPAIALP